jgi:hypothetical protein
MSSKVLRFSALPLFLTGCLLAGCGGGSFSPVSISISPTTATLNPEIQQQFAATVTGTNNTSVQWQVNGITGGSSQAGTITTSGLYTAPTLDKTSQVTVTAVANADSSKTASAQVTVNGIGVGGGSGKVMISPTRAA